MYFEQDVLTFVLVNKEMGITIVFVNKEMGITMFVNKEMGITMFTEFPKRMITWFYSPQITNLHTSMWFRAWHESYFSFKSKWVVCV